MDLKCWMIDYGGIVAKVFAVSRGRARYIAARGINESGWCKTGEALKKMKCRRAPEFDVLAVVCGKEAIRD